MKTIINWKVFFILWIAAILEAATRGEPVAGNVRAILPLSIALGVSSR